MNPYSQFSVCIYLNDKLSSDWQKSFFFLRSHFEYVIILRYVCHVKENKKGLHLGKQMFWQRTQTARINLDCEFAFRRTLLNVCAELEMRVCYVA